MPLTLRTAMLSSFADETFRRFRLLLLGIIVALTGCADRSGHERRTEIVCPWQSQQLGPPRLAGTFDPVQTHCRPYEPFM